MKIKEPAIFFFWLAIFISGLFSGVELAILITLGKKLNSLWTILPFLYIWLSIESEIYVFRQLTKARWWQNKVAKVICAKITNGTNDVQNGEVFKWIRAFGYLGLTISTSVIHFGKIGEFVFVQNREIFRFGRLFLYLGGLIRIAYEILIIKSVAGQLGGIF